MTTGPGLLAHVAAPNTVRPGAFDGHGASLQARVHLSNQMDQEHLEGVEHSLAERSILVAC